MNQAPEIPDRLEQFFAWREELHACTYAFTTLIKAAQNLPPAAPLARAAPSREVKIPAHPKTLRADVLALRASPTPEEAAKAVFAKHVIAPSDDPSYAGQMLAAALVFPTFWNARSVLIYRLLPASFKRIGEDPPRMFGDSHHAHKTYAISLPGIIGSDAIGWYDFIVVNLVTQENKIECLLLGPAKPQSVRLNARAQADLVSAADNGQLETVGRYHKHYKAIVHDPGMNAAIVSFTGTRPDETMKIADCFPGHGHKELGLADTAPFVTYLVTLVLDLHPLLRCSTSHETRRASPTGRPDAESIAKEARIITIA